MLLLFIDHDFNRAILRGLRQRVPGLNAVTAFEAGLSESPDPALLKRAAREGRVMVTHDGRTMPHPSMRQKHLEPPRSAALNS